MTRRNRRVKGKKENQQVPAQTKKRPDDEPQEEEVNPDLQKALKPAPRIEDGPLPARPRAQPVDPQPKAKGKPRKATPDCLKELLPNIDALYIAWMPDNRMVQADFQGQG